MNSVTFINFVFWTILAATVFLWLAYWLGARSSYSAASLRQRTRLLLAGYVSASAVVLCLAIWYLAGLSTLGTARTIPAASRRSIQHLGYYLGTGQPFTFGGSAVQNAFHSPLLRNGEYFTLAPSAPSQASASGSVENWTLSWSPTLHPLRVDGAAVNVADGLWMQRGDSVRVCQTSSPAPECAQLSYSKTVGQDGQDEYTFAWRGKTLTIRFTLARGMSMADLVRTERIWPSDFPLLPDSLWEAFSGITWVREISGDIKSRMGLLVDPGKWPDQGVAVYKNASAIQQPSTPTAPTKQIFSSSVIAYGLIHPLQLDLRNSVRSQISLNGHSRAIVELRFQRPVVWQLPPNDGNGSHSFLLTSTDDHIPMDGYSFDLPDPAKPFYAKAEIKGDELDQWKITSRETDSPADEMVRLGRPSQGILLRLTRARAAWPGSAGIVAIALAAFMFLLAIFVDRRQPLTYRFHCTWATVWVLAATLLTFRFLTAFRMSLLAPVDAGVRDAATFNKTLTIALGALILIPSMMAVAWIAGAMGLWGRMQRLGANFAGAAGGSDSTPFGSRLPRWSIALLGLPSIWVLAGTVFGQQQSFLHLRINIAVHLLTILVLWLVCERMPASANWRALLALALIVPMALQVVLLRDRGDLLYAPPLLVVAFLLWFWDKPERKKNGGAGWTMATALALAPIALAFALIFKSGDNVVQYRWASATGGDDQVLLSTDAPRFDFDHYRRTMLQKWQMLAYAAQGASAPWGYGRMPLSNVGMSYASSMSDSGFAIYVLGEHGPTLAELVAVFLIGIGGALWLAVPWFSGTRASPRESIGLVLVAIGGFFFVNTLYMALANVGWAPFTGQNVPLLSFDSAGDVLQAGASLALASFLLATERTPRTRADQQIFSIKARLWPWRRRWGWTPVLCLLLFTAAGLFGTFLLRVYFLHRDPTVYVVDHNLDKTVLEAIRSHLPEDAKSEGNQTTALKLTQDGRLEQTGLLPLSGTERRLIDNFNLRPDKFDPQQGYFYLVSTPEGPRVHINENYFRVALPFVQRAEWRGAILAAGMNQDTPTVCGLSNRGSVVSYCLGLSEQGAGETREQCLNYQQPAGNPAQQTDPPVLADLQAPRTRLAGSYLLCLDSHGNSLFSLRRKGKDLLMTPDQTGIRILVDGAPHKPGIPLPPQSIIEVIQPNDPDGYQNLIYLGTQRDALAFSQWRNGKRRRVFPHGPEFPMAYALGKVADQTVHTQTDLRLALDLRLQDDLLADFYRFIKHNPDYETTDLFGKRLSAVVLDAYTGEIKAMPSWPYANPAEPDFEHALELAGPREQERMLKNHNLEDHVIGSTIKPLVFSAVTSALWPTDLAQLEALDKADASSSNGFPGHYHGQIAGIPLDSPWNCNSRANATINSHDFLVHSLDFYEEVLGMIGAVADRRAWDSMLSGQSSSKSTSVQYKGKFYLDIGQIRKGPYPHSLFTLDDFDSPGKHPLPSSAYRADTLLSQGMRDVFDAPEFGSSAPRDAAETLQAAANFLPGLKAPADAGDKRLLASVYSNVAPDPLQISPFEHIYPDYILCLLGGGPSCRFNSIWMAQSAARIASRERVTATLEQRPQPHIFGDLPTPLGRRERPDWVPEHLVRPLQEVGLKGGTAAQMASVPIPSRCSGISDSDCYMVLYKTGTLDEDKVDKEESEALLFVVGLWRQGAFVPGSTLAGFLYMQDSKIKNVHGGCPAGMNCDFNKFQFAQPIIAHVAAYLREQRPTVAQTRQQESGTKALHPVQKPQKRTPPGKQRGRRSRRSREK
ncbi:MAG TPA: hypothetical protein VI636_21465 [Candidatus Angelobacter sp.]